MTKPKSVYRLGIVEMSTPSGLVGRHSFGKTTRWVRASQAIFEGWAMYREALRRCRIKLIAWLVFAVIASFIPFAFVYLIRWWNGGPRSDIFHASDLILIAFALIAGSGAEEFISSFNGSKDSFWTRLTSVLVYLSFVLTFGFKSAQILAGQESNVVGFSIAAFAASVVTGAFSIVGSDVKEQLRSSDAAFAAAQTASEEAHNKLAGVIAQLRTDLAAVEAQIGEGQNSDPASVPSTEANVIVVDTKPDGAK